ncbi:MAG: type II secretion system protein [Verrucomicrobia bacterium]|nr:type II secretion system protein [Verrucomicrobiota bacterium]
MKTWTAKTYCGQRAAFSLIELLVVIAIIGVLASLVVGLSSVASARSRESRIRAELNQYITAIDSFKTHFGFYPPDSLSGTNVNPALNPLYYELSGTVVDNVAKSFQAGNGISLKSSEVQTFFGRAGFVNAAVEAKELKPFIANWKSSQTKAVQINGVQVQLLVVPVDLRPSDPAVVPGAGNQRVNPWRYVSTNPTNNPNSFDLWAEVPIGKNQVKLIGNWKE